MHYLHKLKKDQDLDLELVLVEGNEYLGGKIHTVKSEEFTIETGADSIVARHSSVMPLVEDLNLQDEVVYNATGISYLYSKNELHPIPADTIFGIPTSVDSLYRSTLVSDEGKKAALKDLETINKHFTKESSIGEFLRYFLGSELVDNQIAPVLSGVYSGKLDELTIASTLPYLLDYKNEYGSIIKGLEQNKEKFKAGSGKKFLSFKNGLSTLIDRLEEEVKEEASILKGRKVVRIYKENDKYEVVLSNHQKIQANQVVLTTPHHVSQNLLNKEELDKTFQLFSNSTLISIYLGFTISDEELPADGTGFIVADQSDLQCNACTWTSRKWEHTSLNRNLLVRLFYKSSNPTYDLIKDMSEDELVKVALRDIQKSLGIKGVPKTVEVTNWYNLMPNYHLKHAEAVYSLKENMKELFPNVELVGSSYYGVGIGACIQNGKETAERIVNKFADGK